MVKGDYKDEDITGMATRYRELEAQHKSLSEDVLMRVFATPRGDEFAKHGFLRRSEMLWRCVQKIFETIPPDLEERPSQDLLADATIFLHCFIIHIFGACDDLAWILVHEKGITKPNGSDLPSAWVGFRKDNEIVRAQLSKNMVDTLDGLEDWFKHVDEFRHSLAHRIPLYIPPYIVQLDREEDYLRLERESWEALRRGDLGEHQRFKEEQHELTFFRPWFTHSFSENAPHMVIHAQVLADFGAVLELGEATFREL